MVDAKDTSKFVEQMGVMTNGHTTTIHRCMAGIWQSINKNRHEASVKITSVKMEN